MTDRTSADGTATGAGGPAELRRQIAQTRSQLGNTVEELAAKTDIRGRARARAADIRDRAGAMTVQLRSTAAQASQTVQDKAKGAGHVVQDKAKGAGHTVQHKAKEAGHTLQDKAAHAGHGVQDRASRAGHAVEHGAPPPLRAPVQFARRHPRPVVLVAAAGAVFVAVTVMGRRRASQQGTVRRILQHTR